MRRSIHGFTVTLMVCATGLLAVAQGGTFAPVTDAMLANPSPNDWINWRRTYDGWGYSPLNQINTGNAQHLQLAWTWNLPPGFSEPTPLVYNGVMYVPNANANVQALDAATGDLLWEFQKADVARQGYGLMRSLAIYGDRIFVTTRDAHLVALDARTGTLIWDTTVADPKLGFGFTSGPLVVKGKVVTSLNGCQRYKAEGDICFIAAFDPASGKEVWRTSTIARIGEPGGDTWGGLPMNRRAGGDSWITGSYDPTTNLIYWSTSQAKPWAGFQRGDPSGIELYTNCVLALDPETGKIVWYRQLIPGDNHDMDETFENVLVDHDGRNSLFKMGKLGIMWEIDRRTGAFISAHDLGYQTLYRLDSRTGTLTLREGMLPKPGGSGIDFCPSVGGFKSWRAMAYHPATQIFYIPLYLNCAIATFGDVTPGASEGGVGPNRRDMHFHPESPNSLGELVALDVRGRTRWSHRTRTPIDSAVLTTGGGLVVAGDWDRNLFVFDAVTGKILFQTRLSTSIQGYPVTYAVRGRQYIAIPVGTETQTGWGNNPTTLTPERKRPGPGNVMFVFALPQTNALSR